MKNTIINNVDYTKWAIDELWADSFDQNTLSPIDVAKNRVDYSDFVHDIKVTSNGVEFPTEYDIDGKVVDYKVAFTPQELKTVVRILVAENETEAFDEFINVNTDKN